MRRFAKRFRLYYTTISYLKLEQILWRFVFFSRKKTKLSTTAKKIAQPLQLQPSLAYPRSHFAPENFTFLSKEHHLEEDDWDFAGYGKLWTYHLNYFDYLNQAEMTKEDGLKLIYKFNQNLVQRSNGLEPFPISLRIVNWIKFITRYQIQNTAIDHSLYQQLLVLQRKREYYLLGNHLLENGVAFLFGAYYFRSREFYYYAKRILEREIPEQVMSDGGHFERSPMYHQIILFRLLDCLNLIRSNEIYFAKPTLEKLVYQACIRMSNYLHTITFQSGAVPRFGDTAPDMALPPQDLLSYGKKLGLPQNEQVALTTSGYRMIRKAAYEMFLDIGEIGPRYIPGHAHSDTLSFEMQVAGRNFLVDTGVSTYEANALREQERSTSAHNTVQVGNHNQTEVWSSFRVGRRARILKHQENQREITCSHTGYAWLGVIHQRHFIFDDDKVIIKDALTSTNYPAQAFFHLAPCLTPEAIADGVIGTQLGTLHFRGHQNIRIENYSYALKFNTLQEAKVVIVEFSQFLYTELKDFAGGEIY